MRVKAKRHLGTLSLYNPMTTTCRQQSATDLLDMRISPTVFFLCSILIAPTSPAPAPAPDAPASPAGGCLSDQGCPASHPVCSKWGYCQDASYKPPPTSSNTKEASPAPTLAPIYEDILAEIYEEPTSDLVENKKDKHQRSSPEVQSQLEDLLVEIYEEPTSDLKEKYEYQSSSSEHQSQLEDLVAEIYEEPTSDLLQNEKYKDQRSSSEDQSQLEDLLADIYEEPSSNLIEKEKFDDQSYPSEVQSQLVSACSSNADCPQDNPVCSEWGHCQCASYQPGGTSCWNLAAPILELL